MRGTRFAQRTVLLSRYVDYTHLLARKCQPSMIELLTPWKIFLGEEQHNTKFLLSETYHYNVPVVSYMCNQAGLLLFLQRN